MEILILIVLILLNGLFALSEIALVSSKKVRLEHLKQSGKRGAKIALSLLDHSEDFLSAIQVGITLIGIVTGVYGGINLANDLAPFLAQVPYLSPYASQLSLSLIVVVITYFSIVVGELVPKTIALNNPENVAVAVAPIVYYFSKLFYPFVFLLSLSTNAINRLLGIKKQNQNMSEAELRHMIKIATSEGVIEQQQTKIHERAFYFADKKARHVMTHRSEIEWVDVSVDWDDLKQRLYEVKHSRIVACRGKLDDFVGIISVCEFFKLCNKNNSNPIDQIITPSVVVPENMSAHHVLELMRKEKTHISLVVNEYGELEGIITLHDIMENLTGHIPQEGDSDEPDLFIRDDQSVLVSGEAPVEILAEVIENFWVDFEEVDYSTVAGFVFTELNKIPQIGDSFIFNGYKIEVVDLDGKRIDKVLITKIMNE